jgi:hypothetical protein
MNRKGLWLRTSTRPKEFTREKRKNKKNNT